MNSFILSPDTDLHLISCPCNGGLPSAPTLLWFQATAPRSVPFFPSTVSHHPTAFCILVKMYYSSSTLFLSMNKYYHFRPDLSRFFPFPFKNASGILAARCTSCIAWHILLCTAAIRRRLYQMGDWIPPLIQVCCSPPTEVGVISHLIYILPVIYMFAVCKASISLRTAMLFGRFLSQIRQISRSGILEVRWSCTTSPYLMASFASASG